MTGIKISKRLEICDEKMLKIIEFLYDFIVFEVLVAVSWKKS
jgi:hypothetical protein